MNGVVSQRIAIVIVLWNSDEFENARGTPASTSSTHLVAGKLGEEVGIVGQRLDLEPGTVGVDSQKLRAVGGEGDLLHAVGLDQPEEVAVANGARGTAAALDDGEVVGGSSGGGGGNDGRFEGRGGGHVHVHGHEATAAATAGAAIGVEARGRLEGDGITEEVSGGQNEDGGCGELHCY